MANLLLHSLQEFDEILLAVLDRTRPRSVLEIGSETGAFSDRLLTFCESTGAELVTVEPHPSPHLIAKAIDSDRFHLYQGLSIPYLLDPGCRSEVALIDGDHNYFTVYHELTLLAQAGRAAGITGTALLHDVAWPCGRRDSYYDPRGLPPEAVHPHTFELGVTLDHDGVVEGGFRGEGHFAWALHEGGPRNGVLTAVEDFLKENPEFVFRSVGAVFGLGAVTVKDSAADRVVAEVFAPYDNALVRRLERNRLELYLKVLELQDALHAPRPAAAVNILFQQSEGMRV